MKSHLFRPRRRWSRAAVVAAAACTALAGLLVPAAHAGDDQGAPAYYDSGLARTPYMGWNTYYGLGAPTETEVRSVADHLVSSGLKAAGYDIVWLDGGWQATPPRGPDGRLAADRTRFPSGMPALVSYLHKRGLRAGIYTDAGVYDPQNCGLGSGGHAREDARQFARWKFDAVKVDFLCGIFKHADPAPAFREFSAAVAASGRPMVLNLCNPLTDDWGYPHTPEQDAGYSYVFGPTAADSWRSGTDIAFGSPTAGEWPNILRNMDRNAAHPEAQGPGHYNDPDYLIPMRKFADGGLELTEEESTTQFVMWAQMASPLVLGSDPRTLPASMLRTLRNPEIIAVDQDPLGIQGVRVATSATGDVYSKVLSGTGERSVVLLNRSSEPASMTVRFSDAGLKGSVAVRDLRARTDRGAFTGEYTTTVPEHGTAFLRLTGTDAVPGADLGGTASASPALVRFDDTSAVAFVRAADGSLREQRRSGTTWPGSWTRLGGPVGGRILGQPAAYGSAGGRIDLFVRGTDSVAYRRVYSGGSWGRWIRLGGTLTDAPTVAFTGPSDWTLFARGAGGAVISRGTSTGWSSLGGPRDEPVYGRPSAVTDASGTYVAVRTPDDGVWLRVRKPSGEWSGWTGLGGVISGSPTLLATEGRVYLFARASDYTLWQRNLVGGEWGGWFPRGEFASASFYGALGVAAGADGSAWVSVRGVDGRVHQTVL